MEAKHTVVQVIDSLFRGGAQKVVVDIVEALPDCNHVVCYWSPELDLKPELEKLGVTLVRIPFYGVWSLPYAWLRFYQLINKIKPRYIHSHMFVPNLLARTLPRSNFLTLATYHGECLEGNGWKAKLIRWVESKTLDRSDKLLAVSEYIRMYLVSKLKPLREIHVVHNFGRAGATARLLPQLPLRLVASSNNHPYKNYPLLLRAMQQLKDQPVELDIYGFGMTEIKDMASALGLRNVNFKGVVNDVTLVLPEYNVFVISSNSGEGFSLALLEAMNCGLPIICSNLPQFIEAVGQEALIFDKEDGGELAAGIRRLIDEPKLITTLSTGSKNRAQLFSKAIFVSRIRAIYGRT